MGPDAHRSGAAAVEWIVLFQTPSTGQVSNTRPCPMEASGSPTPAPFGRARYTQPALSCRLI